jgi:diamine N-acetyltransferase
LIHSNLLKIRKTALQDLEFVLVVEQDEVNKPFIAQWTSRQHQDALYDDNMLHLIIEDTEGKKVGYAILIGLKEPNHSLCIKRITVNSKGFGYGKEAIRLLIQWVFEHTLTHRLWLDVKHFNHRAQHVYQTVGFVLEGTLRDCIKNGDAYESLNVMSILKTEYIVTQS